MLWKAYEVVFRLRSPLHSGWRTVGNLQMTRPYVTGRMLWGALTMRLTRDGAGDKPASDSSEYQEIGEKVSRTLAFTYFYPALKSGKNYEVKWPWKEKADFRRRFLGSYASTALTYPQYVAAEGSLHEVEFISPRTIDDGQAVYLFGYFFEQDGCSLNWRGVIHRLQLGGERGYGWGRVELASGPKEITNYQLFGGAAIFEGSDDKPSLTVFKGHYLLAHTKAEQALPVQGEIEPLMGWGWKSTNADEKHAGQHIEHNAVCFVPGSKLNAQMSFRICKLGIWEKR